MWFLYFWAISTVCCIILALNLGNAIVKKFKKDGVSFKFEKTSFSERLINWFPIILPFINILLIILSYFMFGTIYDRMKEKQIKKIKETNNEL